MKALGGGLGIYLVNDQIGGGNANREITTFLQLIIPRLATD
jgi:hypothetical protein